MTRVISPKQSNMRLDRIHPVLIRPNWRRRRGFQVESPNGLLRRLGIAAIRKTNVQSFDHDSSRSIVWKGLFTEIRATTVVVTPTVQIIPEYPKCRLSPSPFVGSRPSHLGPQFVTLSRGVGTTSIKRANITTTRCNVIPSHTRSHLTQFSVRLSRPFVFGPGWTMCDQ
jgi:hypothetical protein